MCRHTSTSTTWLTLGTSIPTATITRSGIRTFTCLRTESSSERAFTARRVCPLAAMSLLNESCRSPMSSILSPRKMRQVHHENCLARLYASGRLPRNVRSNEPIADDFARLTLNRPSQKIPPLNSRRSAECRVVAPDAKVVRVNLGELVRGRVELAKREGGAWTGEVRESIPLDFSCVGGGDRPLQVLESLVVKMKKGPLYFSRVTPHRLASKSGRQDLNLRPFDPQSNALPGCATARDGRRAANSTATAEPPS